MTEELYRCTPYIRILNYAFKVKLGRNLFLPTPALFLLVATGQMFVNLLSKCNYNSHEYLLLQ